MRAWWLLTLIVATGVATGCKVTPEQISTWKGTQKGPGKLREVVQENSDPQLRGLAYAALVEIGMGADAATDFGKVDAKVRGPIVHAAIEPLVRALGDSVSANVQTTTTQRAAKDALFNLRGDASPPDRAQIDAVLLKWTTTDLAARASLGGQSTEKILRAIGPNAVPALLPLVHPGPELPTACRLIGELGDPAQKAEAAKAVIKIAESGAGPRSITDETLRSIGFVGGPQATDFLLQMARGAPVDVRKRALYALAQGALSAGDARALDGALGIAADAKQPGDVREAAFQVLERVGPSAVGGLVKLLSDKDEVVRWRAVEASFKAGGTEAIARVLPALPEDRPIKSEDLDSYVVHDLGLLGKEALPALQTAAKQPGHPCGQIAAIRAIGHVGGAGDVAPLTALGADAAQMGAACKVLRPASTVGAEAKAAAHALAHKK